MADPPSRNPSPSADSPSPDPPAGSGTDAVAYQPRVRDASRFVTARGLRHHLRVWNTGPQAVSGDASPRPSAEVPTLLMLHGWMDVSASFQFVVDALAGQWHVIAPDWRGFGLTEGSPGRARAVDSYAFADYLGDLDALLDELSPDAPVRMVAHSMGGNVAMLYAGIRPERVAGLVNLEGFGLPETSPAEAVGRYRRWLTELKQPASLRDFGSLDEVATRLIRTNPRLAPDKARFLAERWSLPTQGGSRYVLRADPAHKRINPVPYRVDEALSCWAAVEAPVLWVASRERSPLLGFTNTGNYRRRLAVIRRLEEVEVADAGHMLHHDQPGVIAGLIEEFFSR